MTSHPNPPAFARAGFDGPDMQDEGHDGMTLRDYFAGQTIAGIVLGPGHQKFSPGEIAQAAYRVADAMLAERAGRES